MKERIGLGVLSIFLICLMWTFAMSNGKASEAAPVFKKSDWNLILVNKQHPIPEDYSFELVHFMGSWQCDSRIEEPLKQMFEDAKSEDVYLSVRSPYREPEKQKYLFKRKMLININSGDSFLESYRKTAREVTIPGTSEHELGLALDIVCNNYTELNDGFGETDAGKWLAENCYKYGFILRYPQNKENITGIMYEPWHFRYVGVEAATIITEKKITLEEFVEDL